LANKEEARDFLELRRDGRGRVADGDPRMKNNFK
jgi:hypothetical protein